MALRLAGEPVGIQERIEALAYAPGVQDSGDLEPATKSITARSKQATPDYTANLTLAASPSPKLVVLRTALRLQVTIDSFGGAPSATQLSYAVEVNSVERLTGVWTATPPQAGYAALDLTVGQFNLGTANQVKVYLWVDQGNAVVSVCQLWLALGTSQASPNGNAVLMLSHQGLLSIMVRINRLGSGTPLYRLCYPGTYWYWASGAGAGAEIAMPASVVYQPHWVLWGSVDTDVNYIEINYMTLRSGY